MGKIVNLGSGNVPDFTYAMTGIVAAVEQFQAGVACTRDRFSFLKGFPASNVCQPALGEWRSRGYSAIRGRNRLRPTIDEALRTQGHSCQDMKS